MDEIATNSGFKILAESDGFTVYTYSGGDIFVKDNHTDINFRIGRHGSCVAVTANTLKLTPYSVNGLPAFLIG